MRWHPGPIRAPPRGGCRQGPVSGARSPSLRRHFLVVGSSHGGSAYDRRSRRLAVPSRAAQGFRGIHGACCTRAHTTL